MIKSLIIKADRLVLDMMTRYVRRWIAYHKFKKHKVDFMIRVEWIMFGVFIVWALAVPAMLYAVQGDMLGAVIHACLWSFLGVMEWFGVQYTIHKLKPLHDWMFSMREDPAFYAIEKESCERMFVEGRRRRLEMHAWLMGITLALFAVFTVTSAHGDPNNFVWQFLLVNAIVSCLKRYIIYVFDFEPPKKKKKASQSITELVSRLWQDLVGGLTPQPAFAYDQR